jgi:purine nucleoside phosphorylase
LDSGFAAARPPNDKSKTSLLPHAARVVVACGLADASESFGIDGDVVAVVDHVNVLGDSPLIGLGNCFPDMSDPYPRRFREAAACVAAERGMKLHEAICVACPDSTPRPAWTKVLGTCVFGTSIAPVALAAAKDSVPVLGLALLSQARGRSDARETGRNDLYKNFAEFGFECAARLSQQVN